MGIYFEVRASSNPEGEGEQLFFPVRFDIREQAERTAQHYAKSGFFSQVWQVRECNPISKGEPPYLVNDYLCEYAAAKVAA